MTGPSNKRQKRAEYQKQTQASLEGVGTPSSADGKAAAGGGGAGSGKIALPKKKFYRQRAHANVFSDHALVYPQCPEDVDWSTHYPAFVDQAEAEVQKAIMPTLHYKPVTLQKQVEIADIGCGFGGLLIALSPVFPNTLMVGMELRNQVLTYVTSRIMALRSNHSQQPPTTVDDTDKTYPPFSNISAIRTNAMKFMPQYFPKGSLSKIFLCFPDPHFKQRKHKARIVSRALCAEYAYVLKRGSGKIYTITDVEELHQWMARCFDGPSSKLQQSSSSIENSDQKPNPNPDENENEDDDHGESTTGVEQLFERIPDSELANDPCVRIMSEETEEAKKVTRNGGKKFIGVWRRRDDPAWP